MNRELFPIEISKFSQENHYFRFSRSSLTIYSFIILFFGIVVIGLLLFNVDISVQSRGMIRSQAEPTEILSSTNGEVVSVYLYENKRVSRGDTLVVFDSGKLDEQLQILSQKYELYSDYIEDLEKLVANTIIGLKTDLVKSDYEQYNQKLKEYDLKINTETKKFNRNKLLFEQDVIAESEYESSEFELKQLVSEKQYLKEQAKADWHKSLFQYKTELQSMRDTQEQLAYERRFYVMTAPCDGFISNFSGIHRGSILFSNQEIATINPVEHLLVECYVNPSDIGYLGQGNEASFQIDAYNYNQWGLAKGRITDISNQPYQRDGSVYFLVKCDLSQESLKLKSGYEGKLKNGLTLTSRFHITRRSLFDLLFDKTDDWLNPKILTANN